jgi:hypothetical protein
MARGPLGGLAGLRSLPSSAVRVLGVGVGFVVLVAALFAGVGAWQEREVSADPGPAAPEPTPPPAPVPDAPEPGDGDDDEVGDDDTEGDAPDGAEDGDDAGESTPPPPVQGPRPQDVTVQLLNGIGADGSAAVTRARTTLSEAGFNIRATSNARTYDATTIFYTDGYEAEARLVGSVLGVNAINAMSTLPADRRLSPSVMVHVVLGADRR